MTLKKIIAVLTVIAATALGGLVFPAYAVTYVYDSLNRLTEVDFDDGTVLKYTYDDIGNPTGKSSCNGQYISITIISGAGGTISPSSANISCGGSQTFTITPNAHYYVADVEIDAVHNGSMSSYTFSNVSSNQTISATFASAPVINTRTNAGYPSLQAAYDDTLRTHSGDTILTQAVTLTEDFTADRDDMSSVTIDGGYNSDYSANPYKTTIKGAVAINNGTVTLKNFAISN